MPTIRIRPKAKSDLADIWDYIADDSEQRADSFLDLIEEKIDTLAKNPLIGRGRNELVEGLRSWAIKPYVVFYLPLPDGVEVIRVLHGARDMENIFLEDDSF